MFINGKKMAKCNGKTLFFVLTKKRKYLYVQKFKT